MGREEEEAESEGWDWADWNQLEPLSDPSWDAADETAVAQLSVRPEGWDVISVGSDWDWAEQSWVPDHWEASEGAWVRLDWEKSERRDAPSEAAVFCDSSDQENCDAAESADGARESWEEPVSRSQDWEGRVTRSRDWEGQVSRSWDWEGSTSLLAWAALRLRRSSSSGFCQSQQRLHWAQGWPGSLGCWQKWG